MFAYYSQKTSPQKEARAIPTHMLSFAVATAAEPRGRSLSLLQPVLASDAPSGPQSPPAKRCLSWCPDNLQQPWSVKCTWPLSCGGCRACSVNRRNERPQPTQHGCASHAVFPKHKVVLCTVPKASSSTWRELARRVHAVDKGTPSVDHWCGLQRDDFQGCLLDQSEAPPVVTSFEALQKLVMKEHYTPAVFLRDPMERALSMWSGTHHANGPDANVTSFRQFVGQLERHAYGPNQHMSPQMSLCNFGRTQNETGTGIKWKLGASTPRWNSNSRETTWRAQSFVAELFGSKMLESIKMGWTQCRGNHSQPEFKNDEFFSFDSTARKEEGLMTPDLAERITALYPGDVEAYSHAEMQYGSPSPSPSPSPASSSRTSTSLSWSIR